jgi:hypothetical protein
MVNIPGNENNATRDLPDVGSDEIADDDRDDEAGDRFLSSH